MSLYNLLIVDDEPKIVRYLHEFLSSRTDLDLELYKAFSSEEAWELLQHVKMDIVLCDIHMPGMDGLELQGKANEMWPNCRFIFLSGYDEFDYVQRAMRGGGFDYILKLESDDAIAASVSKATASLEEELATKRSLMRADRQMRSAMPILRNNLLLSLLHHEVMPRQLEDSHFKELELPLLASKPFLLIAGRVDCWASRYKIMDRSLIGYAIHNIADEIISDRASFSSVTINSGEFAWFIQPKDTDWETCVTYAAGMLSDIQKACDKLLDIPISLAVGRDPLDWRHLADQYGYLRRKLMNGPGQQAELITTSGNRNDGSCFSSALSERIVQMIHAIPLLFETGQHEEFIRSVDEITELTDQLTQHSDSSSLLLEIQFSLASFLLNQANKLNNNEGKKRNRSAFIGFCAYVANADQWEEAKKRLYMAVNELLQMRSDNQQNSSEQVITAIHQFIEANLARDLSLDCLSKVVHLSPVYLSRLYKQLTGLCLTEYIRQSRLEKVCELLKQSHLKMYEIADMTGFESSQYMSRVFRKAYKMTPLEFREKKQTYTLQP